MYKTLLIIVAGMLLCSARSEAVELAPGQTTGAPEDAYEGAPPAGDVVASRSTPFEVSVVNQGVRYFQQGTLSQQVIREAGTGQLSFLYTVGGGQSSATTDLISLAGTGFSGLTTNVLSSVDFPPLLERSADGDTITSVGSGPFGSLLVRTNALSYAEGGLERAAIRFQGDAGGTPDQFVTLDVLRPVPEPGALSLLASAGVLALKRRRRA